MKFSKWLPIIAVTLILFSSCAPVRMGMPKSGEMAPMRMPAGQVMGGSSKDKSFAIENPYAFRNERKIQDITQNRKIIRTSNISMFVEKFEESTDKIEATTQRYGGVVANKTYQKYTNSINGNLTVWIPAEKLMDFVKEISEFGKVNSSSITATDISDQYYDMEARLRSSQKQEERLLSLLDREDTKLPEILELEKELARVRGDIETMQGKKLMWDQQVAYSTVNITITQDIQAAREPDDIWKPLRRAIRDAKPTFLSSVGAIISFIAIIITVTVAVLPWLILILIVVLIWRKFLARKWARCRTKQKAYEKAKDEAEMAKEADKPGVVKDSEGIKADERVPAEGNKITDNISGEGHKNV